MRAVGLFFVCVVLLLTSTAYSQTGRQNEALVRYARTAVTRTEKALSDLLRFYDAGGVSPDKVREVREALAESKILLAEAEGNQREVVAQLRFLVEQDNAALQQSRTAAAQGAINAAQLAIIEQEAVYRRVRLANASGDKQAQIRALGQLTATVKISAEANARLFAQKRIDRATLRQSQKELAQAYYELAVVKDDKESVIKYLGILVALNQQELQASYGRLSPIAIADLKRVTIDLEAELAFANGKMSEYQKKLQTLVQLDQQAVQRSRAGSLGAYETAQRQFDLADSQARLATAKKGE